MSYDALLDLQSRRAAHRAIGVTVAAVIAFALACLYNYEELRHERAAHSRQEAQRALVAIEAHSVRLFDYADSYLRSIRAFCQNHGVGAPLHDFIRKIEAPRAAAFSGIISVIDRDGNILFHSEIDDDKVGALGNFTKFDHYRYFQSHPGDSLFVGPTRVGAVSGKYQFRLARPLLKDGVFDGLIVLTLLPDSISALLRDLSLGPRSAAAMLTSESKLIARVPPPAEGDYDTPTRGSNPWSDEEGQRSGSLGAAISPIDGIRRELFFRRLADYPVVILVGLGDGDFEGALAGPRLNLILLASAFALTGAVVCLLMLRLIRQNRGLVAAEMASREATTLLERSNADLEQFAYVASHDLQTPLRSVAGFVQLLDRRYGDRLDAEAREFITFAVDATKQMSRQITDLLEYSRIAMQSEPSMPIPAGEAMAEAVHNLTASIGETGATIVQGRLPVVLAHRPLLVSLMQNLIDNAIKYRHPDRPPEITVTAEPMDKAWWRMSVRDNGVGIEPAYFDKIFIMFQRLYPSGSAEGSGIGLALCKRIVHRFGGEIRVESVPGSGSTFSFTIAGAE